MSPSLTKFRVSGVPLLSAGAMTTPVAVSDGLWAHVKVYSRGGENTLHAHPQENHLFVVLDGVAAFVDADERCTRVGRYEGMLIPAGAPYRFSSEGEGNLVMLRVGCPAAGAERGEDVQGFPGPMGMRTRPDGSALPPSSPDNGSAAADPVPIPGAFFPLADRGAATVEESR
jgi:mannose-6-phosphate isomerase-like protein (cupin superfamily)